MKPFQDKRILITGGTVTIVKSLCTRKVDAILPMLPEVCADRNGDGCLRSEYSSSGHAMTFDKTVTMLKMRRLMPEDVPVAGGELVA